MVGDVGDAVIAVEGAEAEHLDVADEEVVYHRAVVLAEGVVGDGVAGAVGQGAGILEADTTEVGKRAVFGAVAFGVHVATHDDGYATGFCLVQFGSHRVGNHLRSAHAGVLAHVVEVGVEVGELLAALAVAEAGHGDGAEASGTFVFRRYLGCEAEPSGGVGEQLQPQGVIVDGHELARLHAVVAAHAHAAVLRQAAVEVLQLVDQRLLQAQGRGLLLANHAHHGVAPQLPAVGALAVVPRVVAYVERDDLQVVGGLAAAAQEQQGEKDWGEVFFHNIFRGLAAHAPTTETAIPVIYCSPGHNKSAISAL